MPSLTNDQKTTVEGKLDALETKLTANINKNSEIMNLIKHLKNLCADDPKNIDGTSIDKADLDTFYTNLIAKADAIE